MFRDKKKRILLVVLSAGLCAVLLWLKPWSREKKQNDKLYSDLETLQKIGRIRVGILQNTTDYYLDNGNIQGFQFEMAELMAKHLGLTPRYVVYNTYWDNFYALLNNEVDVLAMNLNPSVMGEQFFCYTFPHSSSEHVLVQRKKDLYVNEKLEINFGKDSLNVGKKILGVPLFSAFYYDALNLLYQSDNEWIKLQIDASSDVTNLLAMLDTGGLDMLIADAQTMKSNALLYPALDYSVKITKPLPQSWAVRKGNASLCGAIDQWTKNFVQTPTYKQLLTKYFSNQSSNRQRIGRQQRMKLLGSISVYDDLIKKYAKAEHLDWRFVAAIIFQESKFNPEAQGRGGSYGLMQMMPATARHYGIELNSSAEKQIAYGCKHIHRLVKKYEENYAKKDDLLKIVLMAYNTGGGNVDAVRRLTQEKGLNPDNWRDIEYVCRNASDKSFRHENTNIKAKSGLKYVYEVWICYLHYKNMDNEK